MNFYKLSLYLTIFLMGSISCGTKEQKLNDIYAEIRKSKQSSTREMDDKKLNAIKKLTVINDSNTPDSLEAIFYSIDTTIDWHWEYQFKIMEVLGELNTEKSLRTFSKLISTRNLGFPGSRFFLRNLYDKTENCKYLFPDLVKALEFQNYMEDDVLIIIQNGYKNNHLKKEDLISSKPYLIDFYKRLKVERDSLPGWKHYRGYYSSYLPDLLLCLRIYNDSSLNNIFRESLIDNQDFIDYHKMTNMADYNNESLPKMRIIFQAALGLIENDQRVKKDYLDKICLDPVYRLNLYKTLVKLKKEDLFPAEFLTQQSMAEADLATIMDMNPEFGLPDKLKYVGARAISSGEKAGNYYFFEAFWFIDRNRTNRDIYVSGPQPINKSISIEHGSCTFRYVKDISDTNVAAKINIIMNEIQEKED